ncbi:MAG: chemotaxis protein CheW [Kineosporiaceae bacterium]
MSDASAPAPAALAATSGLAADATMYCTFRIDGLYLGIDAGVVQEVLREQAVTPVPLAPPEVRGLINLRGQIVTAIDLGMKLGLPRSERRMNVVVRTGPEAVSLLVDAIDAVVTLPAADHAPVPSTVDPAIAEHLVATGTLDAELLLVLDPAAAVSLAGAA